MRYTLRELIVRWVGVLSLLPMVFYKPAFAGDPQVETIRVITYNVQFLPGLASVKNKRLHPEYRAERIAEELSQFDIVGLQETFHGKYRGQIISQVKQLWEGKLQSVESPTPKGFFTSGGCLILSRLPITDSNSTVYANFSKPADHGLRADGFAAKGVIHARLARDSDSNERLDVFVTHLEARDDDLRPLQYAEMTTFIKERSDPRWPALIVGDMNTRGAKPFREDSESQYSKLVELLRKARPNCDLIDVWPYLKGDALGGTNEQESHEIGKRIDYLFVLNPPRPNAQLKPISVEVRLFQDPKVTALSDHNAVVAELEWHLP
ncbi:MAG: hypothetical protein GXP26_00085 [Planctomycetes bacterium]|nr:hypothetical protein [Planctomycetota bacterium]